MALHRISLSLYSGPMWGMSSLLTAYLLSLGLFLIPCPSLLFARSPSAHAWQAQWLGPACPPAADMNGASWIWSDEAGTDPARNAKPGTRFFRREIHLQANAKVVSAMALFTADNHFKLSVNGKLLGGGNDWQKPQAIDIAQALRPGVNTLIVQAENDPAEGPVNAAGVIGKISVEQEGRAVQHVVTDVKWHSAETLSATGWKPVRAMGNLGIAPWGAIQTDATSAHVNLWTCYRKQFMLKEKPATAIARIAVDSKYWLWLNGKLVVYEGGLKRGPTPNDTYFDRLDLAPFLQQGENTLAVLVWFWGKDGFSHKNSGENGLVFELETNTNERLLSDTSWKALRHPAYGNTGAPHPNYRMQDANIYFDARLDIGDWTLPGFADASWKTAAAFGTPPASPWNRLVERPIPLWRTGTLTHYENAAALPEISTGAPIIARLPRNITVSPYLKIKAPAGLTIDMRTDNYKGGSEYNFRSEYVTREGLQEFESLAYLNGHWMIYSIPPGVEILALRYRETRYDTEHVGNFTCDDPFLISLATKARNTMNLNMRDCIQDPDRERAQWWGDAVVLMNQILYTCDHRGALLVRKAVDNLVDWQKPNGVLYSPVPTGSYDCELPMQMLASIGEQGFWNYYLQTGDREAIQKAYPAVKRYLSLWKIGQDGLVIHRAGGWDWADWGENIDAPVIENAWLYQALKAAIKMAKLTGHEGDVPGYEALRQSILKNYNRVLWQGTEYRSPGYTGLTDERGHGVAVVFGLAKPEQYPALLKVFQNSFHASPYMEKFVLEALYQMNEAEAALARMKKRYSKMVASEWTTLWEGWGIGAEGFGGGSYNHGWAGGPLTLMHEYMAGIRPTSPAFATYSVRPQLGTLTRITCASNTPKGLVQVEMVREAERFRLKLTAPGQTTATVHLPLVKYGHRVIRVNERPLWLNGKPNGEIPGITPAGEAEGWTRFTVAPGIWEFETR